MNLPQDARGDRWLNSTSGYASQRQPAAQVNRFRRHISALELLHLDRGVHAPCGVPPNRANHHICSGFQVYIQ